MKTLQSILVVALLSSLCRAGIIPQGAVKSVAHPKYRPDTYALFGDHDVDCGHIAIVKRGDEKKCQERCHQYSSLLKEDCNAYTFKPGKNGQESSCELKNYRCRPSNWKRKHNSGLLGGCSYWCDRIPKGVDMSVCRNSDGSRWSCHDHEDDRDNGSGGKPKDPHHPGGPKDTKDPHHPGGPKDPKDPHHPGGPKDPKDPHHPHHPHHPGPSQKAKPKPKPKTKFPLDLGLGPRYWRRDMSDACPAPMTACPVVKSDGALGEGFDCVETDQDLNQCGGCLGTGGVDCEKIAHAEMVGCSSGRCKVFRCAEGYYAKGDTCFRKLGQIVFEQPNGY